MTRPAEEDFIGLEASRAAESIGPLAAQTAETSNEPGKRITGDSKEEGHRLAPEQEEEVFIKSGRRIVKRGRSGHKRGHILTMAAPSNGVLLSGAAGKYDAGMSQRQQPLLSRVGEDLHAGVHDIQGNRSNDNRLDGSDSRGEVEAPPQDEQPERDASDHPACISLQERRG